MSYRTIKLDHEGDVGILLLNRPEKMNAISDEMAIELCEALDELNRDARVGAVVITGAGRAFCAGADISRFEAGIEARDNKAGDVQPRSRPRLNWIEQVRSGKPVICAVNGAAIGAGLTRTLPCDVRIASEKAKFSMRFVLVGIVPEIASTQILPQLVGLQVSADLMLSGRTIDAEEALRIGLVLQVVDHDSLIGSAIELAQEYAGIGPTMLQETKALLYRNSVEQDITLVTRREGEAIARCTGTAEQREAIAAFREKRQPDFRSLRR
ncbi:MAG: enoyl-CoA hydratase-related protein [Gammaproteobacteria bacterium]|nr:enoyl-CoA hydratase-related protein [Gammaproteobacteria bacterium]